MNNNSQNSKDIALVYMVAGISSRFGGKIKQFARVGPNHETLIECSLMQALPAGFTKIIFVVGNLTEKPFYEKFGNDYKGIPVSYALQKYDPAIRDKPWGTVDAVCSLRGLIDCPFVICNGDDLYGKNTFKTIVENLGEQGDEITIGYKLSEVLPETGTTNRGIFDIKNGYVKNLTEKFNIIKTDLSVSDCKLEDLCSMNIFGLHPSTIEMLYSRLVEFKEQNSGNRKIECLLPNELSSLITQNKIKMRIYPTNDKWLGVTNPGDEEYVKKDLIL